MEMKATLSAIRSPCISLILALETEQGSKHFMYAQNEYQMTHLRNIVESANFASQIWGEVSGNKTRHIIDKLSLPVEDSQNKLEKYSETILRKLEDERQLEGQRSHRMDTGFLSRIREEHEAEALGSKITLLKEDNEGLRSERDELEKGNIGAQKQMPKLKEEKASWQQKYFLA